METGIRSIEVKRDGEGNAYRVRLIFGPHYFIELDRREEGGVTFVLGATHHGFQADASEVGGELESFIEEIRKHHPTNVVD